MKEAGVANVEEKDRGWRGRRQRRGVEMRQREGDGAKERKDTGKEEGWIVWIGGREKWSKGGERWKKRAEKRRR